MPRPDRIHYHRRSRVLEVQFGAERFELPAELLRVYSPSAEVRGHSPEERRLQTGKKHVQITGIEAVGNYAIRLTFDDGHDSGLYSWRYLRDLAERQNHYWQQYLQQLSAAGQSRDPEVQVLHFDP